MAIFVTEDKRCLVQGASGETGRILTDHMAKFGTDVVAGVSPGKSVEQIGDTPLYDTVTQAEAATDSFELSFVVVPAPYFESACLEAIEAGVGTVVAIAEDVPVQDTLRVLRMAEAYDTRLIGPNTAGIISPGKAATLLARYDTARFFQEGSVGAVARSGSLVLDLASQLTAEDIGQSTILSVGGDPYIGTTPAEVLRLLDADQQTEAILYAGEIGGPFEREAAAVIREIDTPVYASIAGRHAPPGKTMGHAGAISSGESNKLDVLEAAGATVAPSPFDLPDLLASEHT